MYGDVRTDESGRIVLFDDIDGEKQMFAPANRVPAENAPVVGHMLGAAGEEFIASDPAPTLLDGYIPAADPANPYDGVEFNLELILAEAEKTGHPITPPADMPEGVEGALATPSQIDLDRLFDVMEIHHEQAVDPALHHTAAVTFGPVAQLTDTPDAAFFAGLFDPAHAIDELFHYINSAAQS